MKWLCEMKSGLSLKPQGAYVSCQRLRLVHRADVA